MNIIPAGLLGYLLGSIPFGIVITRLLGLGDLRKIGSGNIGATNVLRTGSKGAALATLVLDAAKGGVAVMVAGWLWGGWAAALAGFTAFLGHLYPVWLGFKGGKGVATYLGILLALNLWAGLAACATWLAVALVFRISSLSALVASALAPVWLALFGAPAAILPAAAMAGLIFWRHRSNIERLKNGTEPRISFGKKS